MAICMLLMPLFSSQYIKEDKHVVLIWQTEVMKNEKNL